MRGQRASTVGTFIAIALGLVPLGAWITHVVTCLSDGSWGFLIAGALFFPIAIIHGIAIWFGVWH
jgi:hypothetical protein